MACITIARQIMNLVARNTRNSMASAAAAAAPLVSLAPSSQPLLPDQPLLPSQLLVAGSEAINMLIDALNRRLL
jgi:hypothetical protein